MKKKRLNMTSEFQRLYQQKMKCQFSGCVEESLGNKLFCCQSHEDKHAETLCKQCKLCPRYGESEYCSTDCKKKYDNINITFVPKKSWFDVHGNGHLSREERKASYDNDLDWDAHTGD